MGRIIDPIRQSLIPKDSPLRKLCFRRLPASKLVQVKAVYRFAHSQSHVFVGKCGALYLDDIPNNTSKWYYMPGSSVWSVDLLAALEKLGVVAEGVTEEHIKIAKKEAELREKQSSMRKFIKGSRLLGFPMTRKEQAMIEQLFGVEKATELLTCDPRSIW